MLGVDRPRRIGSMIQRELASIIRSRLPDRGLALVSITGVDVSKDLKRAKVYISIIGEDNAQAEGTQLLNDESKMLRRHLSKSLNLRNTPAIKIFYDKSIERGVRLSQYIDELSPGRERSLETLASDEQTSS